MQKLWDVHLCMNHLYLGSTLHCFAVLRHCQFPNLNVNTRNDLSVNNELAVSTNSSYELPDQPLAECQQCSNSQTSTNPTIIRNLNDVETKLFGRNPHICDSSNGQHKHQCYELIQQKSDEVEVSDHIQFLITEASAPKAPSIQEKEPPDDVDILT